MDGEEKRKGVHGQNNFIIIIIIIVSLFCLPFLPGKVSFFFFDYRVTKTIISKIQYTTGLVDF